MAMAMAAQMRKELEAGTWRGQAKGEAAGAAGPKKPVPAPYMSAQYKEDAMRTTGALCLRSEAFFDGASLLTALIYGMHAIPAAAGNQCHVHGLDRLRFGLESSSEWPLLSGETFWTLRCLVPTAG